MKPVRLPFDDWLEAEEKKGGFVRLADKDPDRCDFQLAVDRVRDTLSYLLTKYDKVVFAEIDEFIGCSQGLAHYIDNWDGIVQVTNGFNVTQRLGQESPIDISRPILAQRRWWWPDKLYCKPLLTTVPLTYLWGFHRCHQYEWQEPDPNLYLIHLRQMDYDIALHRNLERQKNEVDSEYAKQKDGPGFQTWLDSHNLIQWWNLPNDILTEIPQFIKEIPI